MCLISSHLVLSFLFTEIKSFPRKIPSTPLIDKIFLPFYSTKKRGSGVGLFLVKRIIDDHEGTITLESQEGVTTVQIILPF